MSKTVSDRRVYNISRYKRDIYDLVDHWSEYRASVNNPFIDRGFAERIRLVITQVNGYRIGSFAHTRKALEAGVPVEHLRQLVAGDWKDLPQDELIALNFARDYALNDGKTDQDSVQKLVEFYGPDVSKDILSTIRTISLTSLFGNTFDAFRRRMIGRPAKDSSLNQEMGVLLGSIIFFPCAILQKVFSKDGSAQALLL